MISIKHFIVAGALILNAAEASASVAPPLAAMIMAASGKDDAPRQATLKAVAPMQLFSRAQRACLPEAWRAVDPSTVVLNRAQRNCIAKAAATGATP